MMWIFLIVVIGLAGVYVVINRNNPALQQNNQSDQQSLDGSSASDQSSDGNGVGDSNTASIYNSPNDPNNATQQVARVAFEQMKALDQSGRNPFDGSTGNDAAVNQTIEDTIKDKSFFADSYYVDITKIKTTKDNSRDAKLRYVKQIEHIGATYPAKSEYQNVIMRIQDDINQACNSGDPGINREIADYYKQLADVYLNVVVPTDWAKLHRTVVQHFKQGGLLFEAIANCPNDPLKTIAATKTLPQFALDAKTMKDTFEKMYNEIK